MSGNHNVTMLEKNVTTPDAALGSAPTVCTTADGRSPVTAPRAPVLTQPNLCRRAREPHIDVVFFENLVVLAPIHTSIAS
ncbi:hypothetical protein VNO78_24430 [Psophocarpus tetragonolobus]|uniref:Uncharacterized protein n=1 Tax=Psophocarpus tetragonolobus TaxID=3891 RepID=A0AAN9S4L1_PSOTE